MNEGTCEEGATSTELFDHGDGRDEVPTLTPMFFVDGQATDAQIGELAEELRRESMLSIEPATKFSGHLCVDESHERFAEQANVFWFFGEVHGRFSLLGRGPSRQRVSVMRSCPEKSGPGG